MDSPDFLGKSRESCMIIKGGGDVAALLVFVPERQKPNYFNILNS